MNKREMVVTGKKVSFAEAEDDELLFWANKSWQDRVKEAERLRRMIWTHLLGKYPEKMEKVGGFVNWASMDA